MLIEQKVNDDLFCIINFFLDEKFLELNPVISGGFALELYSVYNDINVRKKVLEQINYQSAFNWGPSVKKKYFKNKDIDLWFLEDHSIYDEEQEIYELIKEYSMETNFFKGNKYVPRKDYSLAFKSSLKYLPRHNLSYSSQWANTFISKFYQHPTQIIKVKYKSIKDLLLNFDLEHNQVAFYKDKFYFTENFQKSFENKTININNSFWETASINQKAQTLLRIDKYYNLYDYFLSNDSIEKINLFYLEFNISEEILNSEKGEVNSTLGEILTDYNYSNDKNFISSRQISYILEKMSKFLSHLLCLGHSDKLIPYLSVNKFFGATVLTYMNYKKKNFNSLIEHEINI